MATFGKNLSNVSYDKLNLPEELEIAVIRSTWNSEITEKLADGAVETLVKAGLKEGNIHLYQVPGSYELPLGAQWAFEIWNVHGVVCLGSIIRGETSHFDYVSQAVSQGIKDVSLKYNKPVAFGVLTDDNLQQSIDRSGGKHGNKGVEAAMTVLEMISLSYDYNRIKRI
ncbi:MAG TPA: 6,7-dimethyl-8-ribityllumazine synthase [Flavobacteriales bacterium]|jgi:6,7-dimethyl-8-ribityllumazine synthase|nr:6,7-dimethyl-8-ribityllumazine synthase [Flavobacteriales bacterium]